MNNHRLTRWLPVVVAALGVTACDAMGNDAYRGTPLFAMTGTIISPLATGPTDVNVYLLWASTATLPNVAEQLPILPTFPTTFRLDVFNTPEVDESWNSPSEPPWTRLTIGHVVAATSDADFGEYMSFPTHHRDPGILGVDPRHMLYYMPDGVPAGSKTAAVLHGPASPGFHMYDVKCIGPAKAAEIRACLAQYRAEGRPEELQPIMETCGSYDPDIEWLQLSPDDMQTRLTVELIDDLPSYRPDASECL